jgi:signal transduction histidine kinase
VELTVSDNGGGIPDDILPKVFDPYFTTKEKGSGIGLYMSKMIIEGHMGGHLSAHNSGGGAEFVVTIPHGARKDGQTA